MKIVATLEEDNTLPTHTEILKADGTVLLKKVFLALVVGLHRQGIATIAAVAMV